MITTTIKQIRFDQRAAQQLSAREMARVTGSRNEDEQKAGFDALGIRWHYRKRLPSGRPNTGAGIEAYGRSVAMAYAFDPRGPWWWSDLEDDRG